MSKKEIKPKKRDITKELNSKEEKCKHEWRFSFQDSKYYSHFYCIHCLKEISNEEL